MWLCENEVNVEIQLLTLPVYRISSELYYKQREEFAERHMYHGSEETIRVAKEFHRKSPKYKKIYVEHLNNKYGGTWEFNEVIGHIKLHFLGNQIRGEYWKVNAKRIVKTRSKTFEYVTHKLAAEISIPPNVSDQEIFEYICKYVDRCKKELKQRTIDESQLLSIGRFIKWRELMRTSA